MIFSGAAGHLRKFCFFFPSLGDSRFPNLFEQTSDIVRRLGHRVVEFEFRKILETKHPGFLVPELERFDDDGLIVRLATVFPAGRPGFESFFAQAPVCGKLQEGFDRRT